MRMSTISTTTTFNLGEESTDHIQIQDIDNGVFCIKNGIYNLIRDIHFNPNFPQNQNIRHACKKSKTVKVWENNAWITKALCDIFEQLASRYKSMLYERFVILQRNGKIPYEDSITINKSFATFMLSNAYFTCSQKISALIENTRGTVAGMGVPNAWAL